jgi:hypothetical protein
MEAEREEEIRREIGNGGAVAYERGLRGGT